MSKSRNLKFGIILLVAILSCFIVGCKKSTPVNDIFFNMNEGEQIVLIVGEELNMKDYISIKPSGATNKGYRLKSLDEDVVKIEKKTIVAVGEGNAQVRVISSDNSLKEDLVTVVVKNTKTVLPKPGNLDLSVDTQILSFDKVPFATSYKLKINNEEFDLGNSNVFPLSNYSGDVFNTLLNVQIKAISPTYTKALEDSEFSEDYIYQAGAVENIEVRNGVLTFDKSFDALGVNLYIGNDLIVSGSSATSFSLNELNPSYTGVSTQIHIEAVVTDEIKENYDRDVSYWNSTKESVDLNVLDVPIVSVNQTTLTWQNIAHAQGYAIIIDGEEVDCVDSNSFDLATLEDFEDLFVADEIHTIKVDPILNDLSLNVGKTTKTNKIKVKQLAKTSISCDGHEVSWTADDNALAYSFSLSGGGIDVTYSTISNKISFLGYEAGEYRLTVQALGGFVDENGVYYISSKQVSKTFKKYAPVRAKIENYVLKVGDLEDSVCYVEFDNSELNTTLTGNDAELDLSTFDFEVGKHTIRVSRKGSEDSIASETLTLSFVQLDIVKDLKIENGVVLFDSSLVDASATLKLEICKGTDVEYSVEGAAAKNHTFNTTNSKGEKYLDAGSYNASIYVLGNGVSTFSAKGKNGGPCETLEFDVLPAPEVSLKSTSETILVVEEAEGVESYDVYLVETTDGKTAKSASSLVGQMVDGEFAFELSKGGIKFSVQGTGDGSRYLNSVHTFIEVAKLEKPILSYDNDAEVFTKVELNDPSIVAGYEFALNDVVEDYDFVTPKHFNENVSATLKSVAVVKKDGVYYVDSDTTVFHLTKISNLATISIDAFNNVAIKPQDRYGIYTLAVEFVLKSGNQLFTPKEDGVLSNGTLDINYSYLNGVYTVEVIEDYEAIFEEMHDGFGVKVKFMLPQDAAYINSEFSLVQELEFVTITSETKFTVNEENQLIVTPEEHSQQHGLILVVNDNDDLTFVSGETTMVSNSGEMAFVYDETSKSYVIDLLDSGYEPCDDAFKSNFTVKVKYTSHIDGTASHLDSDYSASATINVLPDATISREGQQLKIEHPLNDYTYNNYGLVINKKYLLRLTEDSITHGDGCILFDYEFIYSNTPEENLEEVNTVAVVVLNIETSEENLELSKRGNEILIQKTPSVELVSIKDNSVDDNSVIVEFETYETTYEKDYYITFHTADGEEILPKRYVDDDAKDGVISFKLDLIEELEGAFYIQALVRASCTYNSIEVFNSEISNKLEYTKLEAVTNLKVSESVLTFDPVDNVVGYEIYEKTGTGYTKFNKGLCSINSFEFVNITKSKEIVVKAISKDGGYTNSTYSSSITINPISVFTLEVKNGEFYVTLPMQVLAIMMSGDAVVVPEITNSQGETVELDLESEESNVGLVGVNQIRISPQVVLEYSTESLQPEAFTFKIKIRYGETEETSFFLNSESVDITVYGLLAPSNVVKTVNESEVEFISWTPNANNHINGEDVEVYYEFKLEHTVGANTKTYLSSDPKLKYLDAGEYVSYNPQQILRDFKFPVGYDANDDGNLDVQFQEGYYKISVRTMPNGTLEGYNFCYSQFSVAHEFEILSKSIVSVSEGAILWNEQAKAAKYKLEIFKDDEEEAFFTDYVTTNAYDFTNVVFDTYSGVLKVVVTAISTRDDVLSGLSSDAKYVYRLPEATSAHIEDGYLVISANKYISAAEVEFVDTVSGKKYIEQCTNEDAITNLAALGIGSWKGFEDHAKINATFMFALKLNEETLAILDGRDYTINVKLIGNSNQNWGTITSSKTMNLAALKATKMNANLNTVNYGVVQFKPNTNYATIKETPTVSYTSIIDLNYMFNGVEATGFWHNTAVYKIRFGKSEEFVDIYAVDYFSLMSAIEQETITSNEYEVINRTNGLYAVVKYNVSETETIYFNVYLENKINLKDYDEISYFNTTQTMTNGVNTWSYAAQEKTIKLADGGSFVMAVTMLGGDSRTESEIIVGELNAGTSTLRTFVRYGLNNLESLNGKVEFVDLMPFEKGKELDSPVYKVIVTPFNTIDDQVFYLYYGAEKDAKQIASNVDGENHLLATYVKVEKDKNVEGSLFFDLSQYIAAGTYKATIRTLAGLGNGKDEDIHYLLNAKEPTTSYTFYKLSDVEFAANNGVLEFEQSMIVRDSNIIHCDNYEITLYDSENKPYVYTLDRTNEYAEFDDIEHIVRYTVPSHLNFGETILPIEAGNEYKIKIKAIGADNFVLSGSYAKTGENDKVFSFTKSEGISDLRIEDGILKWKVNDLAGHTNTIIKITYLDANKEVKVIYVTVNDVNKVEDEEYLYHYYKFSDEKYNGEYITSDLDYFISAYTVGNGSILNSNYCEEITVTRLKTIDENSIKTTDGVLVWETVEDANYYEILINGKTYTAVENSLNVTELDLSAGTYPINIRAIGTEKINSSWLLDSVEGFIQLGLVEIGSIEVGGDKVSWKAVDSAPGYSIIFNYMDLEGNDQLVETVVETNEFTMETTGMIGRFTISITPIGIGDGKVFNSKPIEFTSSSDAPTQVKNLEFDSANNRFVVEVDNSDFLSSDTIELIYNFEEYTSQTDKAVATRITNRIPYQTGMYEEIIDENTTRYYLPITVMGVYSNIYAQVVRPNTLSSIKTQIDDVDYHIFSYGAGTFADETNEANPYRIYNAEQLLNISHFPSANYILTSSVNLTGLDLSTRYEQHNALIANEFTGYLDGANFSIIGFNIDDATSKDIITVENANNFALFGSLKNATIKNLKIGKDDVELIINNTLTSTSSSALKLSLLASTANNSTIHNIIVPNLTLELVQDGKLTKRVGSVYVGGLVAEITSTTITNSTVDVSVNIDANMSSDVEVYVGGAAAKATISNVEGSTLSLNVKTNSSNLITYVGGTFAHYVGNTLRAHGVKNTSVEFNMTNVQALYVGGVTGFARYMLIDTCETTGAYTKSYISNNTYVGGLVGHAQSAIIQNSGSFMNLNLAVSNTTNKFIGAIVGMISVQNGISAEITNCYSHYYVEGQEETVVSTSQMTIGMFGSATGSSVQGNYKKEQ